jgi:hypothetical protein
MGCLLSFIDQRMRKPPDQPSDGSSVPLLVLSKDTRQVVGQAAQRQHVNVDETRMSDSIRQVDQMLGGANEMIKAMTREVDDLKRKAVELVQSFGKRELAASAKTELARIKYKIQLKSSLLANLLQKDRLLETIRTTAQHSLVNSQLINQLNDSKISERIQTTEDKSTNESKVFQQAFDKLRGTMDQLTATGDDLDISTGDVDDFTSSAAAMKDDDIRTLVGDWASELGSSLEERKDAVRKRPKQEYQRINCRQ